MRVLRCKCPKPWLTQSLLKSTTKKEVRFQWPQRLLELKEPQQLERVTSWARLVLRCTRQATLRSQPKVHSGSESAGSVHVRPGVAAVQPNPLRSQSRHSVENRSTKNLKRKSTLSRETLTSSRMSREKSRRQSKKKLSRKAREHRNQPRQRSSPLRGRGKEIARTQARRMFNKQPSSQMRIIVLKLQS